MHIVCMFQSINACKCVKSWPDKDMLIVQVLDTYMPGIRVTGQLSAAKLNFTTVVESPCVADWVIYRAAGTWVSTGFYFLESAQTSEIIPGDLWIHQATRALVQDLRGRRHASK